MVRSLSFGTPLAKRRFNGADSAILAYLASPPMQATSINLLTRDGGLCATFTPGLTHEQYTALAHAIRHDGDTYAEMSELLKRLGTAWGCKVTVDPC